MVALFRGHKHLRYMEAITAKGSQCNAKFCSNGRLYANRQSLQKVTNRIATFCSKSPSYANKQSLQNLANTIAKYCIKRPFYANRESLQKL